VDRFSGTPIRFGLFELDPAAGELCKEGRRVHLQDKPLQLLLALLERPGEVVTRGELQGAVWVDTDFLDFDASLNSSVRKLRHALGDSADSPRFVATVPRHGYRFIAPVSLARPAPGEGAEHEGAARRRWGWAALSLLALSFAVAALWRASTPVEVRPAGSEPARLAVLPFVNLDREAERELYTDGLTEELIAGLGALDHERLVVIARTSAMTYKGTDKRIPEIGRELGVDYVLEGSARWEGERVRITAQLVAADDGSHLWARSYERPANEIFAVQREIAGLVARSLEL
jgi:TolB-like protein/DNA-binding winged helix-turn-helix (wHTH) protein